MFTDGSGDGVWVAELAQLERTYATGMALSLEKALDLALPKAGPA